MARESASEKLKKLQEKMGSIKVGGDRRFWRPKKGRNLIRVLPEVGEMDFFFQEVGRHYNLPGGGSEYCPNFTTDGEVPCPICELVSELYKASSDANRALIDKLRVKKSFWINIIVRAEKEDEDDQGPFIYTPGVMVFKSFQTMIGDPEYGEFYSPDDDGTDLIIDRKGEGIETEYQVMARRKIIPLHEDPDQVEEWLNAAEDLSYVLLSEDPDEDEDLGQDAVLQLLPYDRILEKYKIGPGVDVEDLVEEEKKPARASSKKRKRKVKEEEDEDELPEEEDEVGSAIRQRRAARSRRRRR